MALAIAICPHFQGCIGYHVHDALDDGATREQIVETIGVAVMMAEARHSWMGPRCSTH